MNNLQDVVKAIKLLTNYPQAFAWKDFGDAGNGCTGRLDILQTQKEVNNFAEQLSLVLRAMPKGKILHADLAKAVADTMEMQWVAFDTLVKMTARILQSCETYEAFEGFVKFTALVQAKMNEKNVTKISTLEELFAMQKAPERR